MSETVFAKDGDWDNVESAIIGGSALLSMITLGYAPIYGVADADLTPEQRQALLDQSDAAYMEQTNSGYLPPVGAAIGKGVETVNEGLGDPIGHIIKPVLGELKPILIAMAVLAAAVYVGPLISALTPRR